MPKKLGVIFVAAGAVMILSALLLLLYNWYEDDRAGREAEEMLAEVESIMVQKQTADDDTEEKFPSAYGFEYAGYLEIPALELALPVINDWDENRLKIAPCRHFGSVADDDLVIAAHNYRNHFGRLKRLTVGDSVLFTDMDGQQISYTVVRTATLDPTDVDAVRYSGNDLVLYTCTKDGQTRVTVFCDRVADDAA